MPGIPMKGELFAFTDWHLGRLDGYPTVFSAGNVVTGKGNIVSSRKHAREISATMAELFLGQADEAHAQAREQGNAIADQIQQQPPIEAATLEALRARVSARQQAIGYSGDYPSWIEKVTPPDLQ
jgi:hypothetical protein